MKKIVLLTSLIAIFANPTFAACDYKNQCPSPTAVPSTLGSFFAEKSGSNYLLENIVQTVLENELKKATNQNFKTTLEVFGTNELIAGKFKSLSITGNNLNIEGFHLSALKIKTLCDFNHINLKSKPISLKENMVLEVSAEITAEDLRNTIEYKNYSQVFSKLNLSDFGISAFRVYSQTINITGGKLYFTINATPIGPYKPMDIAIGADLKAQNGGIVTSQIDFINLYTGFDLTRFSNLLSTIYNLNFPVQLPGNQHANIQIQNINIVEDKIYVNGVVFIPKSSG